MLPVMRATMNRLLRIIPIIIVAVLWGVIAPRGNSQDTEATPTDNTPPTELTPTDGAEPGAGDLREAPADPDAGGLSQSGAWVAKLRQGGAIVVVQVILSIIGLTYVIGSFVTLQRKKFVPDGLKDQARKLWSERDYLTLEDLGHQSRSTLGRIVSFLARHRNNSMQDVSVTAGDLASREISLGLRRAYPISVIGSLLPLLGLLGTVFGMIECFDTVALAGDMGDPTLLAGGISKALVTTAVGLSLAIPLLYAYHHLKSKSNEFAAMLEEDAGDLITLWFLEPAETGLAED
jgi:biopolymer transport protein ExbB